MLYTSGRPQGFEGRTGYQIFVDRFCREGSAPEPMEGRILKEWTDETPKWWPDEDGMYRNQYFYGGNLKGITERLHYLNGMGFDLLYISPISQTPSSHHYDVGNQTKIDPWIGTEEDFRELCEKAHRRDMLICVDLVFNHMGSHSTFFQDALAKPNSKYHDWFEWDAEGNPVYWYGFKDMPQCNKLNPDYQEYVFSVCSFYLNMGADGIRLDLGEILPAEFLRKLRQRVKFINPNAIIVSEMWDLATHKENWQIGGDQVDSVMNYPLSDAILRWVRYGNHLHFDYTRQEIAKYPKCAQDVLWNFLDSHDMPRAINMLVADGMNQDPFSGRIWDIEENWRRTYRPYESFDTYGFRNWEKEKDNQFDNEFAQKELELASLLQYFMPGIPIVYYGTETGVTGYKDPFNRKSYPWQKLGGSLIHYQRLGIFRKSQRSILAQGEITEFKVTPSTILVARKAEMGTLYLMINRTNSYQENPVNGWNTEGWKEVYQMRGATKEGSLPPYSAVVYRKESEQT